MSETRASDLLFRIFRFLCLQNESFCSCEDRKISLHECSLISYLIDSSSCNLVLERTSSLRCLFLLFTRSRTDELLTRASYDKSAISSSCCQRLQERCT